MLILFLLCSTTEDAVVPTGHGKLLVQGFIGYGGGVHTLKGMVNLPHTPGVRWTQWECSKCQQNCFPFVVNTSEMPACVCCQEARQEKAKNQK